MSKRYRFLVTAGNTHEAIDRVREWSNIFTGKTGLDVALALLDLGDVTLLTSNLRHAEQHDGYYGRKGMLGIETFRTHAELAELLEEQVGMGGIDAVAMSAAVSDYVPAGVFRVVSRRADAESGRETWVVEDVQAGKVKSSYDEIAITGTKTAKLVDQFRGQWGYKGVLVKFKLEVGISEEKLIEAAEKSRRASGAELIVANTLEMVQGSGGGAWLLGATLRERVERAKLAGRLREVIGEMVEVKKVQS
jgi:phosphopantothenate---cysteine ligase (CTP)